jgi:protein-disulfide isomerase
MHDKIFGAQDQWNGETTNRPKAIFSRLAGEIGLNASQWEECYDSQKYKLQIAANQKEGERRLVQSTPTFVIGDKLIPGALGFDQLKAFVDSAAAKLPAAAPASGDTAPTKAVPAGKSKQ